MNDKNVKRSIIDKNMLPPLFPTHRHTPEFWEQLGRTVATYGFLEEILGKAIFAFTATRKYDPDEVDDAYQVWLPRLERALTDQLWSLAESYGKAARDNPATTTENIDNLINDIKKAAEIRNVLCHGSWRAPDSEGASIPLFVNRQKQVFNNPIDIAYLKQVQVHVAELACNVIDTVTHMGWQFPGAAGPGMPIRAEATNLLSGTICDRALKVMMKKTKKKSVLKKGKTTTSPAKTRSSSDWRSETLARMRKLINDADPEVIEEAKWKKPSNPKGVPTWSHDGIICTGETYKDKVKLTFARGAALKDPARLFNSSLDGNMRRAIDILEGDKIDEKAFKALVRAAVDLNTSKKKR